MTDIVFTPASDDDPSFTPTTTTAHNTLAGRSTAGAHPATAVTYDNDASGLAAETVQEAIDEVAASGGAVDSVNGETGVVVLDAADVGAVPNDAVGLSPGETNRGTWDVAATYAVGDVVLEPGVDLFVATAPSTGDQPSLTPGSWDALDLTGRHVHLGPGATSGDYGTSVGPGATAGDYGTATGYAATAGDYGTSIGPGATSGDFGTATGYAATAGDYGLSVGPFATSGDYGLSVGPGATSGDYGVNIANIYRGTLDPGDPTTPTGATIATGFVDLPETADATNPAADHQRLIARTDGLYVRDQAGTEVGPLGGGGVTRVWLSAGDMAESTGAPTWTPRTNPSPHIPTWTFADAVNRSIRGVFAPVPSGWATMRLVLALRNPGAITGDVRASARLHDLEGTDFYNGAFTIAGIAASDGWLTHEVATGMAVTPGTPVGFYFERAGGNALDTLAGDIGLVGAYIERVT